jgi:hypothetical protein
MIIETIKAAISLLPPSASNRLYYLGHRWRWQKNDNRQHVNYFESYSIPLKREIAAVVARHLPPEGGCLVEFGCSGANNLKLLRDLGVDVTEYWGIDINATAIAFARETFPDDHFFVGDDYSLGDLSEKLPHRFDVFLLVGVLMYLSPERAVALLRWAQDRATSIVIADDTSCADASIGRHQGHFTHSYHRLLRDAGWAIAEEGALRSASGTSLRLRGYLVAHRASC